MRKYGTTLLIWFSLLLSETHTFWENSTQQVNWIIKREVVMPIQWAIKYSADELWFIIMACAILLYIPNRINRTTVLSFLWFTIADALMYIYNYKQEGYEAVYTFLLITWILIYNHEGKRPTDRPGTFAKVEW